jgi:integral membrane sensor domain MASE1
MKAGLPFTFSWKWLARLAGFAGLYFALAPFGNVAVVADGNVSTVWPAAGMAVAGLWWGGYRLAPAIALGAFVFAWFNGVPAPVGAAAALISMLGPIVALFLMRRYIAGPRLFDRVGDVFLFFLCAGAAPALVDALGVASLCWGGVGKWDDFRGLWLLSWAGDLMGTLIAAPTLLGWIRSHPATRVTPVAVYSASFIPEDIAKGYSAGANYFITKPSDLTVLIDIFSAADKCLAADPRNDDALARFSAMAGERS